MSEPMTYEPEIWTVRKDDIYAAIEAIQSGIDYAGECLATHDTDLGRTTRKNRVWAERMEEDLSAMRAAHAMLKRYGPYTAPTP